MTHLKPGAIYHGFRLSEERPVREIGSTARLFRHEKSGARLLFLDNDDDNKVFSITFRTPPSDSTGVAHIVEHSVLCGSRKFNMKEPFVELVKGSLNTYLNAMTFPDKTMYPVASRNDKDFQNLMDVYLDAVFYPNMYDSPEILMQEGWHYELPSPDAELTYKGVVYNEMKGAFSSPEAVLDQEIMASLFPDTTYGYESGGDPDEIPQLTQEAFLAFHRRFYHPSNSYLFLYGKMDIVEKLKFLDEGYLADFDRQAVDSAVETQALFARPRLRRAKYPISPNEESEAKAFLSLNYLVGAATEPAVALGLQALEHLLLRTEAAPLKKALLDAAIGKDVLSMYNDGMLQPAFSIIVSGSEAGRAEEFRRTATETLERLAKEGIDKKLIEASLNLMEFRLREANFGQSPKGLIYNIKCMNSWLYDADPLLHLAYEDALAEVKTALTGDFFEKLIEERLLHNPHSSLVVLEAEKGLAEARAAALKERLRSHKDSLPPEQIARLVETTRALTRRQETPDPPEALAVIPLLELEDIEPEAERLVAAEREAEGVKVLFHPLPTNRIAYLNLYFDAAAVPQAQLPYLYLLTELLGKVATRRYGYMELANEINIHTGGVAYDALAYTDGARDDVFYPKFKIKSKALAGKMDRMAELIGEIAAASRFDDHRRLKELIQQIQSSLAMYLLRNGQQVAASRVMSYFSPSAAYNETGLLTFYEFIADLEKNFARRAAEVERNLAEVSRLVFQKNRLMVSITLEEEDYGRFETALRALLGRFGERPAAPQPYSYEPKRRNEGLMTSGKVQYVAKGANFVKQGFAYHGSLKVLDTILRYDYLWNKIRVQGGAYGAFTQFRRNGNMVMGSYRDPNLAETVAVYDATAAYLRRFTVGEREMTKYIIGTISQMDVPMTPQMKGEVAAECYIRRITQEDLQRERDEILATRQRDIRKLADLIDAAMRENYLCVLGGEQKIMENKDLFAKVKNVFA